MLPSEHRLRRSADFGRAVRAGRRAGRSTVVAHVAVDAHSGAPATVGFVVSKAVGVAVVRNLVKRRLRGIVREELSTLPPGSLVVLRALPAAADVTYDHLRKDALGCLRRAVALAVA